jgi:hypothetical protein
MHTSPQFNFRNIHQSPNKPYTHLSCLLVHTPCFSATTNPPSVSTDLSIWTFQINGVTQCDIYCLAFNYHNIVEVHLY